MNNITPINLSEMGNPASQEEMLGARIIQLAAERYELKQKLEILQSEIIGRNRADALTFQDCGRFIRNNKMLRTTARRQAKLVNKLKERIYKQTITIEQLRGERGSFWKWVRKWIW